MSRGADVLIIGSGIMGSAVALLIRERSPALRITMVDGGPVVGATPGMHLHDVPEPELWAAYNAKAASGIQGFYAGATPVPTDAEGPDELESGLHLLNARILGVTATPFPPSAPGRHVLEVLRERFGAGARAPQPMPMAATREAGGRLLRTGPSRIFPPLGNGGDERFALLPETLATRLELDGAHVRGAEVLDVASGGERHVLEAGVTIVCADTFRAPQLLHASGIRPEALGRHLNEHAFLTGRVLLDLSRSGLALADLPARREDEFAVDSLWLPHTGSSEPFHGQIMNTTYADDGGAPLAYAVAVSLYSPVESRAENRMRFDGGTDLVGMPRFELEYALSDSDGALLDRAREEHAALFRLFSDFDPRTEAALLPAGSSLHPTGTVRAGAQDDGASVTDPTGRVWGFENVYLAGNGVIPTSMVANTTLTATITAVRAARAALRRLVDLGR